ncbi:uncharacterized protein M6B38_349490 [Iris pallida]|uniref:Uncharacterized protein n=1 Tax=Iris pallida TaxID=29817 RepID=A0AAX6GS15_IRIPA|nr:uncharacterized protein M6B38_349490 [Iris pallida]
MMAMAMSEVDMLPRKRGGGAEDRLNGEEEASSTTRPGGRTPLRSDRRLRRRRATSVNGMEAFETLLSVSAAVADRPSSTRKPKVPADATVRNGDGGRRGPVLLRLPPSTRLWWRLLWPTANAMDRRMRASGCRISSTRLWLMSARTWQDWSREGFLQRWMLVWPITRKALEFKFEDFEGLAVPLLAIIQVGSSSTSDVVWIYTLSYAGGIVSGDCVSVELTLGDGCIAAMTTQASTKVAPCLVQNPDHVLDTTALLQKLDIIQGHTLCTNT